MPPAPPDPRAVLVGRAFVDYACQSSLACCSAPTRAPVLDPDLPRIRAALGDTGASLAAAFERGLEDFPPGIEAGLSVATARPGQLSAPWPEPARAVEPLFEVVAQAADGRCTMLDPSRRCRLQLAGGLGALPGPCRLFPRSILALDDGRWEVAHALRCPTVAGLLARDPSGYALIEAPGRGWARYPPIRRCGDSLPCFDRAVTWHDVDALRRAWWEVLDAAASDGLRVLDALGALHEDPARPRPAPEIPVDSLGDGLQGVRLFEVMRAVETLPERGPSWARLRWHLWAALQQPRGLPALARMAEASPAHTTAVAATWLGWAALHDPRPFEVGARAAVSRAITALRLFDAFDGLVRRPRELSWQDAYVASSYVDVSWQGRA